MSEKLFQIEFAPGAQKDLDPLDRETQLVVLKEIQRYLSQSPLKPLKSRIKRMSHFTPPLYRLRIGDYRVYYRFHLGKVVILAILTKKDSERWLKRRR